MYFILKLRHSRMKYLWHFIVHHLHLKHIRVSPTNYELTSLHLNFILKSFKNATSVYTQSVNDVHICRLCRGIHKPLVPSPRSVQLSIEYHFSFWILFISSLGNGTQQGQTFLKDSKLQLTYSMLLLFFAVKFPAYWTRFPRMSTLKVSLSVQEEFGLSTWNSSGTHYCSSLDMFCWSVTWNYRCLSSN